MQAALFAGFLSAFLIELLDRLEQDPMDIIQDVLIYQTQMMRNSSLGAYVPADFSPPEYIVVVNALFYASLGVMLLAAFIAMLIKSWVREFDRGLQAMSLPEQRAKTREFRYLGLEHWKLPEMVAVLPLLIQISLLLFAIGLVLFLFHISKPSFGVTTAIFGIGVLYYAITTSISVFVTSSPFHSPLSRALGTVYRHLHTYICPGIDDFLSPNMDTIPGTTLGRFCRSVKIFFLKSRPFPERNFVDPITATTMDEIQFSIASSALQRVHDSVPNSQHSELVQWSVWQVAGGPALRMPPSFALPFWIFDKGRDEEYLSRLPPAMVVSLLAVSLRTPWFWEDITSAKGFLRHADRSKTPWAQLVVAIFDRVFDNILCYDIWKWLSTTEPKSNDLAKVTQWEDLCLEESLWLLNTLSDLCVHRSVLDIYPFSVGICLAILSHQARKWTDDNQPDAGLLETVVTLVAISKACVTASEQRTLSNSRQYPWLLRNLRDAELIGKLMEDPDPTCHKELISLLFLVLYALISQESELLAAQYFGIITAQSDFTLYTSTLTAIAPVMSAEGLITIGRMLVARQTQDLISIVAEFQTDGFLSQDELFQNYDDQLGASHNPDPNFFAILLLLSHFPLHWMSPQLPEVYLKLNNPWLKLAARVVARLDIPDGSGLDIWSFHDHRIHNMIAASSLLRYVEGDATQFTESVFLASFLDSREFVISSLALEYYMKTIISYADLQAPPCYLSGAICAIFNVVLPDDQLKIGWTILAIFVDGFDRLSVEWRQTFAEAFFALSRQPLPRSQRDMETTAPVEKLKEILTWEYFHKEEQQSEFTDLDFCGLDWMAMAWSLHISQRCGTVLETSAPILAQSQDSDRPTVNEEFILQALCKLLDAAPYYRIVPIMPELYEFVQWFDDGDLSKYRSMIFAHIEEAVRKDEGFQMVHKFDKFQCMWSN